MSRDRHGKGDSGNTAAMGMTIAGKKGKAEHWYSALHGIQTTLKRSGMDHTAFNLQRTP